MSPKILRRCDRCKNFHATFLQNDPVLGKLYLCFKCFQAWQQQQAKAQESKSAEPPRP